MKLTKFLALAFAFLYVTLYAIPIIIYYKNPYPLIRVKLKPISNFRPIIALKNNHNFLFINEYNKIIIHSWTKNI